LCAALQICNRNRPGGNGIPGFFAGIQLAFLRGMLRLSCRALVIVAASLCCAGKLRGHGSIPPVVATQELNRCLSVVRAAARRGAMVDRALARPEANVRVVC
jgi:hypothetical protein